MVEDEANWSIPKGGPLFIPNHISPLTTVPQFQNSLLKQLQELETELDHSSQLSDAAEEDICVDDLKILQEEELVELALKEAFKESGNGNQHVTEMDGAAATEKKKGLRKRKRSKTDHNHVVDDTYIKKVEQLAKIKEKQEEDKATAELHSLNAISKINDLSVPSSDKIERLKSLRSLNSSGKARSLDVQEHIPVLYPEVVLCVEVYHNKRRWTKIQEFLVLAHQTLTELRDKIYCMTDQVMQKAGQHDPSGYFLIEDIFLNDLRDPTAIDYSTPIFDWLKNSEDEALKKWESIVTGELQQKHKAVLGGVTSSSRLPQFRAADMHKTRFCDLRFQLGAGYLYCHQGDCKHTIVIRDMRLIHPEDVQNKAAYPIIMFQLKPRVQKCNVCRISRATKVTVDDKWANENPCYFCDYCYTLLHSNDESPLYDEFSVYDYVHD